VLNENTVYRTGREEYFATSPHSPFRTDTGMMPVVLQWFAVEPRYRVRSVLHRHPSTDTVTVLGTQGEVRRQVRYGYFRFTLPDGEGRPRDLTLNVYLPASPGPDRLPLGVWFTDRTTGKETYHVGRYVDVGDLEPDPDHLYTIDFNMAYNPYCAYNDRYSCAVPRKEDHLDIPVRAGERYHP
jgi:uncharacterized protein (DUF1684 family)